MNRRVAVSVFVVCAWAAPLVTSALASDPPGYDRAAERAFAGTVKAVAVFPAANGAVGVHLDVQTADGLINVHIAPGEFIGRNNFWFFADDQVSIIGAPVSYDGNVAIWARTVQKGSTMLVLRDADGTPKWTPTTDGADGCGVSHSPLPRGTER